MSAPYVPPLPGAPGPPQPADQPSTQTAILAVTAPDGSILISTPLTVIKQDAMSLADVQVAIAYALAGRW